MKSLNLFICAGEASGDAHGEEVVHVLRQITDMKLNVWGMGGPKLRDAQVELVQDSSSLGIIGIADVIKKLPFLLGLEKKLIEEIKNRKPDVALLIDYPGMNLRLAAAIKKYVPSCKVVFYVAPQVWAWNPGRLKKIPQLVDRLLTILPFEEQLHKEAGTSVRFVGNPSAWSIAQLEGLLGDEVIRSLGLNPDCPVIGIFPGSRNREIDFMLPVLLESAKQLKAKIPEVQFILVRAATIEQSKIDQYLEAADLPKDFLKIETSDKNHFILKSVDIAWLTSGTVTLEAACAATPLILGYRENPIFWRGYLLLRKIDKIGLPNIVAGETVCPELLQKACIPENWVKITTRWLQSPDDLERISLNLKLRVQDKLKSEMCPAVNVANEILLIHQLNCASFDNQLYMREQAHQNSQKTLKELNDTGGPRAQLKDKTLN